MGSAFQESLPMEKNFESNFSNFSFEDEEKWYEEVVAAYNNSTLLTFIVLILGLSANLVLLWSFTKGTNKQSRLRPFLINLAVADLMVCFFTIAMELGWRLTVTWTAGDVGCRIFSMTKTIGLYLGTFVVLGMSIDRCYVVLWPLKCTGQRKRRQIFLISAWTAAIVFSIPQAIVFHVERHPDVPEFAQCVTMHTFPNVHYEQAYVLFAILAIYGIPLVLIVTVSIVLLYTIRYTKPATLPSSIMPDNCSTSDFTAEAPGQKLIKPGVFSRKRMDLSPSEFGTLKPLRSRLNTGLQLCHADTSIRRNARTRTLRLSIVIVLAFILNYTPYAAMITTAFVQDQTTISESENEDYGPDSQVMEGLLMLSLSFSTIANPIVYGFYMICTRKRWFSRFSCRCRKRTNGTILV